MEQATDIRGGECHLKLRWDPQNPSHSHYDAILWFDKYGQVFDQNQHDFDRPSPNSQQMMWQHDYKVIDLTVDSDTTPIQQHVYFQYNKNVL